MRLYSTAVVAALYITLSFQLTYAGEQIKEAYILNIPKSIDIESINEELKFKAPCKTYNSRTRRYLLKKDAEVINDLLKSKGFLQSKFKLHECFVVFRPGVSWVVNEIHSSEKNDYLKELKGQVFDSEKYEFLKNEQINHLKMEGMLRARIDESKVVPDFKYKTVNIYIKYNTGEAQKVGNIFVTGQKHTPDDLIKKMAGIKSGDNLNSEIIKAAKRNIEKHDRFLSSSISVKPGKKENVSDVWIKIIEAPRRSLDVKVGMSDVAGFVGDLIWNDRKLYYNTFSSSGEFTYGDKIKDAAINLEAPYFFSDRDTVILNLTFNEDKTSPFLIKNGTLVAAINHEHSIFTHSRLGIELNKRWDAGTTILSPFLNVRWNNLKYKHHLYLDYRIDLKTTVQSNINIKSSWVKQEGFFRYKYAFNRFLGIKLKGGIKVLTNANAKNIPEAERIYLGGPNDVRGYDLNTIGYVSQGGNNGGKDAGWGSVSLNAFPENILSPEIFFDFGTVRSIYSGKFHGDSIGIGMAGEFKFLEYSIGVAKPLNKNSYKIYFNVGGEF